MVLTGEAAAPEATIIVPDEQSWTVLGDDPAALGMDAGFDPGAARRALVADRIPEPLAQPARSLLASLPSDCEIELRELTLPGPVLEPEVAAWRQDGEPEAGGGTTSSHSGHDMGADEHAGHDMNGMGAHEHGDMMAIVGEPSADGLVMEPIELRFGPLATPLPGGVEVEVELDGDVVASSTVRALLGAQDSGDPVPAVPDPLAASAWRAAIAAATSADDPADAGVRRRRLAAVELDRAVSHLAWLRSFGRALGWRSLIDACSGALTRTSELRSQLAGSAPDLRIPTDSLLDEVTGLAESRRMRLRAGGLGRVSFAEAGELGLRGPVARAAGVPDDARIGDPLYGALGFAPVLREEGDARARALVRVEEARAAIELAARALEGKADVIRGSHPEGSTVIVEGPRGPLVVERRAEAWRLTAPGAAAARRSAADAMVGREWSAALAALVSFDLSPWVVGE